MNWFFGFSFRFFLKNIEEKKKRREEKRQRDESSTESERHEENDYRHSKRKLTFNKSTILVSYSGR